MRRARLTKLAGAACFATLVAAPAHAEEPSPRTRYQQLVAEALVEFEASRYEEALVLFEHAYAEKPSARALRGIAKTLFELRSYARSLQSTDAALASTLDPLTGALRDDLVALRERTLRFVGRAIVTTEPRSAQLLIDGTERACPPDAGCVLDMGPHTLRASAPSHEGVERTIEVRSAAPVTLALRLVPLRAPEVASPSRVAPIALGVATTSAATAGLLVSVLWFADRDTAVSRCDEAARAGAHCANASSIATQRDASMWAVGLTSAAVAASATGLVLALAWPRAKPTTRSALECRVGGTGGECAAHW